MRNGMLKDDVKLMKDMLSLLRLHLLLYEHWLETDDYMCMANNQFVNIGGKKKNAEQMPFYL